MKYKAELQGRDFIEVELDSDSAGSAMRVNMVGCSNFMDVMKSMRKNFGPDLRKWPVPTATDHASLLVREIILKLQGQWEFPYQEAELCHCRSVETSTVDQAIVAGAHSAEKVSRWTTASTSCGTCRPQVQKIIDYRLGKKTA